MAVFDEHQNVIMGAAGAGGYTIDQSIRYNDDDTPYMQRTPSGAGDDNTWTFSCWIKRGSDIGSVNTQEGIIGAGDGGSAPARYDGFGFYNDNIQFFTFNGSVTSIYTTAVYRDPSAWYHLVLRYDDTQATNTDRVRIYVNGDLQTLNSPTYPSQNYGSNFNTTYLQRIGANTVATNRGVDGYLADIIMVDGQSLDPSSFGKSDPITGAWVPIKYTGTYGTNGFYITGADSADLGADYSGNGNDFTSGGLTSADQMPDTPTNNFCTLNPVEPVWGAAVTLSDGNLALAGTAATPWNNAIATFKTLPSTGKWIWASKPNTSGAGRGDPWIVNETGLASRNNYVYVDANGWETTFDTASVHTVLNNGASRNASFSYGAGDFSVVCFDADSKKLWFGVYDVSAGTLQFHDGSTGFTGDPGAGTNPTYTLTGNEFSIGFATYTGRSGVVDFGQSDLLSQFTAPTGFKTLCTANLPDPTIADPSAYFQATAYAGSASALEVNQAGNSTFQPDFVWIKQRTDAATNHQLVDAVRGKNLRLESDNTDAEGDVGAGGITSFDADGFSVGTNSNYNAASKNFIAWQWKANGSGSSNTDGSITSTVSADTTSGFSTVTYTGTGSAATIGHGLGVAPDFILVKKRVAGTDDAWIIWHQGLPGPNYYLNFDTGAQDTSVNYWNNTLPTSSVFNVGASNGTNESSKTFVAYLWNEVEGFSKIGKYTGNGSSNGPFVHTGFRPAFILIGKTAVGAGWNWQLRDSTRSPYNVDSKELRANTSDAESSPSGETLDLLSNGFKPRSANGATNQSGYTYIYYAVAETPFKYANAR